MYGKYAYIWVILYLNVSKYTSTMVNHCQMIGGRFSSQLGVPPVIILSINHNNKPVRITNGGYPNSYLKTYQIIPVCCVLHDGDS